MKLQRRERGEPKEYGECPRAAFNRPDGKMWVVEAQKTTHEALREALKHLEHCEVVGMLLNKGNYLPGNSYYGSYYGTYGKQ